MTIHNKKKGNKRNHKKTTTPQIKKWCSVCQKTKQFTYDKNIGHSRCDKCGCTGPINHEQHNRIQTKV